MSTGCFRRYCSNVLFSESATCTDSACPLAHGYRLCETCAVICPSNIFQSHLNGRGHLSNEALRIASAWKRCPLCGIRVLGDAQWTSHVAGASHQKLAARSGRSPCVTPIAEPVDYVPPNHKRCVLCNKNIMQNYWKRHLQGSSHQAHEDLAAVKGAMEQAEKDKEGVTVSHSDGVDFGIISVEAAQRRPALTVHIQSSARSSEFRVAASIPSANRSNNSSFSAQIIGTPVLTTGQDVRVNVTFGLAQFGRFSAQLELSFVRGTQRFIITRQLRAVVGDPVDHQTLQPTTPYVARRRVQWRRGERYYPGKRPPALDAVPWVRQLKQYPIPPGLLEVLNGGSADHVTQTLRAKFLSNAPHNLSTHITTFNTLLWVEEHRTEIDLHVYDMPDVTFRREGKLNFFTVPGLAEKRPSVVVGDCIEVQPMGSRNGHCFEGWVHAVRRDEVGVDFHPSFKATDQQYNVRFKMNRIPMRRQHQAIGFLSPSSERFLFPGNQHAGLTKPAVPADLVITPCNAVVGHNHEQIQAVRSILKMKPGAAPFVIFGPPGTGKTMTMVEAIRQVLLRDSNARILACAPSNSAADELTRRLAILGKDKLFRHNAVTRRTEHIDNALLQFSFVNSQGIFSAPSVEQLSKYKVLISTCGSASFAYGIGLRPGHFTHIFIDEAGQATEPEVMTALKTMVVASTHIVLSGDPKQLGPIVRSSLARTFGLGDSYLERLMSRELYKTQHRGISFIKLVKNFRSHKAILHFPNEQFYDNELRTCGPAATINRYLQWQHLVKPKFPVIFHAVCGKDEREASSPSYFNIDEVTVGKDYINKLLTDQRYRTSGEEIGVIAPYNAQVRKFRTVIANTEQGKKVKVASVEEFQGDERPVIILSTVRSSSELLSYDARYALGFVANPRRFNVAVTRAKSLLIVIGDPSVLCLDPMWRQFLNYVHNHGGWRGVPISWDPNAPVQNDGAFVQAMQEQRVAEIMSFMERAEDPETGGFEGQANMDRIVVEDRD